MFRYLLIALIASGALFASVPPAHASGCGKDCAMKHDSGPSNSGCRVMYGSGILYDNGIAVAVSAPVGWTIDSESGVPGGLHAVFYPEGSSWSGADTVMYAQIVHKDGCRTATLEKVMELDANGPSDSRLDVTSEDGGTMKTSKGRDAVVRLYGGGIHNAVAYIEEEKSVIRLVLSSRSEEGLKDAMPVFREFVGTYLFVSDDVDVNRGCMGGQEQGAARRNVETVGSVSSVGEGGGMLVFAPEGTGGDVTVRVERGVASGIKPGDRVRVAYTEGEVNVASKVIKLYKVKNEPKPCLHTQ